MRVHLIVLIALGACSKAPSGADATPAPAAGTAPAPVAEPAPRGPPEAQRKTCDELASKTRATLDALDKKLDELALPSSARIDRDTKGLGACVVHPSGKGAWILTIEQADALKEVPRVADPDGRMVDRIDQRNIGLNGILNSAGGPSEAIAEVLAGDMADMSAKLARAMGDDPADGAPAPGAPAAERPAAHAPPTAAPEPSSVPEPISRVMGLGPRLAPAEEGQDRFAVRQVIAFVYVGEDGVTHRWLPEPVSDGEPFNLIHQGNVPSRVAIAEVVDWDGDGLVDLAWRHVAGDVIEDVDVGLVRVKDGQARLWRATGDHPIDAIRDVDEDGRPDLLTIQPFAYPDVIPAVEPETVRYLYRSTPDGFTTSDGAVAAWYKKACGGARVELAAEPPSESAGVMLDHAVCARLWGASAAEVDARIAPIIKRFAQSMYGDELRSPYLPEVPVSLR